MLKHTQPRLSQLASAVAVVLGGITLLPAAHAAAPAAGASISNIAVANYTDATGAPKTVNSNEVRTTVLQVASFTLVADRTALATPNSTVNLSHTLTNTGNGTDTFTIALANIANTIDDIDLSGLEVYIDANGDGVPDNTTNVTSVTLAPGESVNLIVVGTTPVTAQSGNQAQVTISATTAQPLAPSQVAAGATISNTDTVTITGGGVISVVKSANVATIADMTDETARTITYTLRYTNSGNATATNVVLTDVLPTNTTYKPDSARWSTSGNTVLTIADDLDLFKLDSGTLTFNVGSVPANTTGTVTFQVVVNANAPVGDVLNVAQFAYDPDGSGVGQPAVPATNTNQVPVAVPARRTGSINDATNDPFADGQLAGNGAIVSPTDQLGAGVVNDAQIISSIAQGASATFRTYVHNTGNLAQVFEVLLPTIPAGATVQLFQADGVTPLTNVSGTTAVDIGPIPVGQTRELVVVVSLPNTTSGTGPGGAGFVTRVEVRPVGAAPNVRDTTTLTIAEVMAARVDLTDDSVDHTNVDGNGDPIIDAANGEGATGTAIIDRATTTPTNAVTFPLGVFNGSNSPDNFNLTVPNLPAGWTAVFLDANGNAVTNTGNIPAGTEASLTVVITPPAGTAAIAYPIDFTIASPVSALTDTMRNQVTVTEVRQLSLVPNRTGQVAPGGTIVYSHTLTNNGNTAEGSTVDNGLNISFAQAGGAGTFTGNVTVAVDLNNNNLIDADEIVTAGDLKQRLPAGLAAGASATILVQVQAPAGALPGQENRTTATVTATGNINTVVPPAAVQVLDVTTVTAGQIRLVKTQALDHDCDGTLSSGNPATPAAYTQGVIEAQPGQCVVYRIVATNEGNATVTDVIVTDATPAFTTINRRLAPTIVNVVVAPAGNGVSAPADGTTGTVRYDVGSLAPAATAQLDFGVQIDE